MSSDKVLYSAVVLTKESQVKLEKALASKIPADWKVFCHHMTVVFGKGLEDKSELGKTVKLTVTDFGISDKAMAVKVTGYQSKNKIPHVTVAVNTVAGGKPFNSNQIKDWNSLEEFELEGVVTEVKQ